MVAAVHKLIIMAFASLMTKHASFSAALIICSSCLPALTPSDLVGVHLEPILLDAPKNVETPVVPHWWPRFDDVVRLRF